MGLLKRASEAGIGLIGMKTVRHLAPKAAMGKGDLTAFDSVYEKKFMESPLNPFQRLTAAADGCGARLSSRVMSAAHSTRRLMIAPFDDPPTLDP